MNIYLVIVTLVAFSMNSFGQEATGLLGHKPLTPVDNLRITLRNTSLRLGYFAKRLSKDTAAGNKDAVQTYTGHVRDEYIRLVDAEKGFIQYVATAKPDLSDEDFQLLNKLQKRKAAGLYDSKLAKDISGDDVVKKIKKEYNELWAKSKSEELQ